MVTAISTLPKLSPARLVATGAADGSICVLNAETGAVYMSVKDFRRAVSCCEVFESKERGLRRLIAADREGRVAIYDLDAKRLVAEKETDCGNVRGLLYLPSGNAFAMISASGALLVFDEMFNQLTFAHVGQGVACARAVDATHLMVATENRELMAYDLTQTNPEPVKVLKLTCKEPVRCFDLTADGKYAVIVSNEVEIWKLANQHCEANFSPTIPVRSICITSDYVSFFLTQDTHIEKWVVDWMITYEGKKYRSPFLQLYKSEGADAADAADAAEGAKDAKAADGQASTTASATTASTTASTTTGSQGVGARSQYKGTIETVAEEGEEEDADD